jgi:hypothetical protein
VAIGVIDGLEFIQIYENTGYGRINVIASIEKLRKLLFEIGSGE